MSRVPVHLNPPYEAHIESGLMARIGEWVRPLAGRGSEVFAITTPPVRRHWGARLEAGLRAAGLEPQVLEMPDGEPHKNLGELERLAEALVRAGADRSALILAFGGGMVGDVAALLASIYMRGVALIQVPTSLVAMVDSALGGKTAVNLASGKNLLGTFYHPKLILADPEVLATLPEREYRSGLAEAIKYGIIRDRQLYACIVAHTQALRERNKLELEHLIAVCLRHKAEVVAADEREAGLRRILNFGHTLGHALESATGYQCFLHGEAVAWGMIAAGEIGVRTGRFERAEADGMQGTILRLCGPLPTIGVRPEEILAHASSDKKAQGGVLHFVLPRAIGEVEIVRDVAQSAVLEALARTIQISRAEPGSGCGMLAG